MGSISEELELLELLHVYMGAGIRYGVRCFQPQRHSLQLQTVSLAT